MAVTITPVFAGTYTKSWDVIADADGDLGGTITHGFGSAPADINLLPLDLDAYGSQWRVTQVTSTLIVLGKTSASGSANTAAQVRVIARLPHSITG